jgi:hypothetical protein
MHLGLLESHGSVTLDHTLSRARKSHIHQGMHVLLLGLHQSLNLHYIKRHDHVSVTGHCRHPVASCDSLYVLQRIVNFYFKMSSD